MAAPVAGRPSPSSQRRGSFWNAAQSGGAVRPAARPFSVAAGMPKARADSTVKATGSPPNLNENSSDPTSTSAIFAWAVFESFGSAFLPAGRFVGVRSLASVPPCATSSKVLAQSSASSRRSFVSACAQWRSGSPASLPATQSSASTGSLVTSVFRRPSSAALRKKA